MMVFSGSVTGAFRSGRYQISQFGSGELLGLLMLLLLLLLLLLEIDGTSAGRIDRSRRSGEIYSKVARALKGIVQGIVRRRTPVLVGAFTI